MKIMVGIMDLFKPREPDELASLKSRTGTLETEMRQAQAYIENLLAEMRQTKTWIDEQAIPQMRGISAEVTDAKAKAISASELATQAQGIVTTLRDETQDLVNTARAIAEYLQGPFAAWLRDDVVAKSMTAAGNIVSAFSTMKAYFQSGFTQLNTAAVYFWNAFQGYYNAIQDDIADIGVWAQALIETSPVTHPFRFQQLCQGLALRIKNAFVETGNQLKGAADSAAEMRNAMTNLKNGADSIGVPAATPMQFTPPPPIGAPKGLDITYGGMDNDPPNRATLGQGYVLQLYREGDQGDNYVVFNLPKKMQKGRIRLTALKDTDWGGSVVYFMVGGRDGDRWPEDYFFCGPTMFGGRTAHYSNNVPGGWQYFDLIPMNVWHSFVIAWDCETGRFNWKVDDQTYYDLPMFGRNFPHTGMTALALYTLPAIPNLHFTSLISSLTLEEA